jgi:hypothetical protein
MEVRVTPDVIKGEQTIIRKGQVPQFRCRVPGYFTQGHQLDPSVFRGGSLKHCPHTLTLSLVSLT